MEISTIKTQFPKLTWINYMEWTMLMQANLEMQGWQYTIDLKDDEEIVNSHDLLPLTMIMSSVPPDMLVDP
jgi:hypothetical protein